MTEAATTEPNAASRWGWGHLAAGLVLLAGVGVLMFFALRSESAASATPECGGQPATILGTPEADEIDGTDGDDVIVSGGGNDVIRSGAGNDLICAGAGNDDIDAGAGDDTVYGEDGNDTANAGPGDDTLFGNSGDDELTLVSGGMVNAGSGDDVLVGSVGDDRLIGGPGDDQLRGKAGQDYLDGGVGADVLWGGTGDDELLGGPGIDTLAGRPGFDRCDGGADEDEADHACERMTGIESATSFATVPCRVRADRTGLGPISDPATRFIKVTVGELQDALVRFPAEAPHDGMAEFRLPNLVPIMVLDPGRLTGFAEVFAGSADAVLVLAVLETDPSPQADGETHPTKRVTAAFVQNDDGKAQLLHRSCDQRIVRSLRVAARVAEIDTSPSASWSALLALAERDTAILDALY